jgi:glycosyltransferase involved in cell wall biosynthesis
MTRRLVILTEIISPYRIPVFNALAQTPGIELHVIFLAETDSALWQWKVYKEDIRFSYEILPHWRLRIFGYNVLINRGVAASLVKAKPDVVVCGGYSYLAMWQAQRWVRRHDIPVLLWSESTMQDQRRRSLMVESLKKSFLRACGGFIVPGKAAAEYLRSFGIPDRVIFTAPNAVDNDFFATSASSARSQAPTLRAQLKLPERYFLFVGRMIANKGIFQLLQAYARLEADLRQRIGLVFAGDGPARTQCEAQAALIQPGTIVFTGFLHREQLALYYGLAECLVFPTFSDPWGLVVNEAMACSLPVITSDIAGATPDLVRDDWNGRVVAAGDLDGLSLAMQELAEAPETTRLMSERSAERIANYTAKAWAEGFASAVTARALGW